MAISLVTHSVGAGTGGNGTPATTGPVDTTGASIVIVATQMYNGSGATGIGVTDNKGNTYTALPSFSSGSGAETEILWVCTNPVVGAGHTVTATGIVGPPYCSCAMQAFGGTSISSVADIATSYIGSGATNPVQPSSGTAYPTYANEVIVTGVAGAGTGTLSIDQGFTITDQQPAGSVYHEIGMAYLIQTAAAGVNPTWTESVSYVVNPSASIASFRQAGGAVSTQGLLAIC